MNTFNENINRILTLVSEAGKIEGRTKFQKIVYILKNKGIGFQEKFKYHYFGPFSSDLQLEIEELVDRKILLEKSSNPYTYELNCNGNFENIDDILNKKDLVNLLNNKDYRELELTSTIYFLYEEGLKDEIIVRKKLALLKPHLVELIDKSFELKKQIDKM